VLNSKSYGLQTETRQYLRRLYAYGKELAGADVADLDNFISGMKQLNLWQGSVSWLLSNRNNIGSGTIALSMGGQSSILTDGSLVNGPTWGNDGIQFTRSLSTYIQTQPLQLLPRAVFCWALFYSTTTAATEQFIIQQGDNNTPPYPGWWLQLLSGNFTFGYNNQELSTLRYRNISYGGINRWSYGSGTRFNTVEQVAYENTIDPFQFTTPGIGYTTNTRRISIGNSLATTSRGFDGNILACGFVTSNMNSDTTTIMKSLLRTTIGKTVPFN
jgi:hypothetical protein